MNMQKTILVLSFFLVSCASNRVSPESEVMLGAVGKYRECYEKSDAKKSNPEKYIVNFHLEVEPDGSVSSAKVEDLQYKDAKFCKCLENEAKKLKFPPGTGKRTVSQPYNFYAN